VQEIRLLVEHLHPTRSVLTSDHIMNLLQEIEGRFPEDQPAMLAVIDRYLELPDEERQLFRLGRRGGALQSMDEFQDPGIRQQLERARAELQTATGRDVEAIITELGDRYI
jgi:hypothetical protein